MSNLTQYEIQHVFQFLQELNTAISLPDFPAQLVSILGLVIESDFALIAGTASDLAHESSGQNKRRTLASVLVAAERDREILNFLSPHILQAYKTAQLISQIKQECEQLHQVLDNTHSIVVDRNGSKKLVTGPAEELMRKYFSVSTYDKNSLPETISNWLQKKIANWLSSADLSAPILPLRVVQGKHILVVRLSVDAANDQYLLILEEQAPLDLSFALLQELGLSKRESEILHWIFHDKSNQQISEILNLSNRTVQKHCENIYNRLGVNSRAAAITQVLQKLGIVMFV